MSKAKARKQLEKLLATGTGSKTKIKKLKKIINRRRKRRPFHDEVNSWRKKLHIVSGSFEQGKRR
jgi:hypothetical protein